MRVTHHNFGVTSLSVGGNYSERNFPVAHTSSVLVAEIRETPNISQPNSVSDAGEEELHLSSPVPAVIVSRSLARFILRI